MQYLVSVIDDKPSSTTPAEQAAINVFDDRLWLIGASPGRLRTGRGLGYRQPR
jgi:hypothetical protein